jgi:8-hydroxy-5-deazaflavin:NADPH oxidoreductase
MKIGIIGVGHIGKTLALKLAAAGHNVSVASSKLPENISQEVLVTGAKAVKVEQAIEEKDVIILSIPLNRIPEVAPLFANLSEERVVIDTSNYYPARDTEIADIEAGMVESLWVVKQLGHKIAKAWNAIGSHSLLANGKNEGSKERIAIPFASDREIDRDVVIKLIHDTGFDAFDTGSLADSWRQQPGAPVYGTDLTENELAEVIDKAEKERLPKRRDIAVAALQERLGDATTNPDADYGVRLSRALYM